MLLLYFSRDTVVHWATCEHDTPNRACKSNKFEKFLTYLIDASIVFWFNSGLFLEDDHHDCSGSAKHSWYKCENGVEQRIGQVRRGAPFWNTDGVKAIVLTPDPRIEGRGTECDAVHPNAKQQDSVGDVVWKDGGVDGRGEQEDESADTDHDNGVQENGHQTCVDES